MLKNFAQMAKFFPNLVTLTFVESLLSLGPCSFFVILKNWSWVRIPPGCKVF
jgi:hypothetical protein